MKILRVTSDLHPEVTGGVGLHAHQLSVDQANSGHQVTVITSNPTNTLPAREKRHGYVVVRAKNLFTIVGNTISVDLFRLFARIARKADVVHIHSHLFYFSNVSSLLSRIMGIPSVLTVHGVFSQSVPMRLQEPFLETVGSATMRSASSVICLSRDDRMLVQKMGVSPRKIVVIPEGVDSDLFHPPMHEENRNNDGLDILFVGRLVPGKGVEQLMEGFSLARKEVPNLLLRIRGDGPLKDEIPQIAKDLDILEYIDVVGRVTLRELVHLYQCADIFALTSFTEGLPKTVLEAMACGLPIICSSLPQLRPVVDKCGILIDPEDVTSIADAIIQLASSPSLRSELGRVSRRRVCEKFDWRMVSLATTNVLEEVAQSKGTNT